MRSEESRGPGLGPSWRRPHTRLLFILRSLTSDPGTKLASWRLSIVLMVLTAFYSLFLAIWAMSSPPEVVRNIASLLVFWLVYLLLLVNTAVCFWRRIPALRKQLGTELTQSARRPDWSAKADAETGSDGIRGKLRRAGYRPRTLESGEIVGVRRRWAALGPFLFHGAFFLVAAGFLLTIGSRSEATLRVAVGEEFSSADEQLVFSSSPRLVAWPTSPIPGFIVDEIRPEFWRDQLLFTVLEADLEFADGKKSTTRINRPLWVGPGTFLRLSGFGYTPRYELSDADGRVVDSAFVKLNVFPPGQRDSISFDAYPHRVFIEVLPDFAVQGGWAVTRTLNLVEPAALVEVYRGKLRLGEAVLRASDGYRFEGLTLRFPEIRYWGEFSLVRDPGAPVLFTGYLVGLIGLLLKIRGGRGEVVWRESGSGGGGLFEGWGDRPARMFRVENGGTEKTQSPDGGTGDAEASSS